MSLIYRGLVWLLLPFILIRLYWKGRAVPGYRQRWRERLGLYTIPPSPDCVWFHAVSVGEVEASFPLIQSLKSRLPELDVLVTCTTPTGSQRIRAVLGRTVSHVYLPYDLPSFVGRFLRHFQPRAGIILETEIWPNLYEGCRLGGIPLAIVNGRLSERSCRGYQRVLPLVRDSLSTLTQLHAQTSADADRYIRLGANPAIVRVPGNVKFDISFDEESLSKAAAFRQGVLGDRPVWIAGSTHPGEDEAVLEVHREVKRIHPEVLLILAPRHTERTSELAEICQRLGLSVQLRSDKRGISPHTSVMLLNTLGELRWVYGAADVAFVGGSLVERGGHNVLEPAAAGIPVLFGPHTDNFAEIVRGLSERKGGHTVANAGELVLSVTTLLKDRALRKAIGSAGLAFLDENRGAVSLITESLVEMLDRGKRGPLESD